MNPNDAAPNAAKETIDQANSVEKQMKVEADTTAEANAEPAADNSIISDVNYKPLSEIAAAKPDVPAVDPTVLVNANGPEQFKARKIKDKRTPAIIGFIAGAVVLAGLAIWGIVAFLSHDSGGAVAKEGVKAFFIENANGDGTYLAFNDEGERISEASFKDASEFNSKGYAVVRNKDGDKYAILTNTGKFSIPYDKYSKIEALGPFFLASKDGETLLIDGTGKEIMKSVSRGELTHGLPVVATNQFTTIFSGDGEKIGEYTSTLTSVSKIVKNGMSTILGGDTLYVIDVNNGSVIASFKTDTLYEIRYVTGDGTMAIISGDVNRDADKYKVLHDGKIFDWKDAQSPQAQKDHLYYTKGTKKVIFAKDDKPFEVGAGKNMLVFDSEHYASYLLDYGIGYHDFVVVSNGESKAIDGLSEIEKTTGGYNIKFKETRRGNIVDKDGNLLFDEQKIDEKEIFKITGPYQNGYYIANNHFLYDKDLNEIANADVLDMLEPMDDGNYLIDHLSKTYGVMDKDGKILIKSDACASLEVAGSYYLCGTSANEYSLYNKEGKALLEGFKSILVKDSHIETDNGD